VNWSPDRPLVVLIRNTGSSSGLGRPIHYDQWRLLSIRVAFEDGSVEWLHVKIPDGRVSQDVVVQIPERRQAE
jgi:hypothetical protein